MKHSQHWLLALIVAGAITQWPALLHAQFGYGAIQQRATLTIKPDGSSLLRSESFEPRSMAEQQVRMMERAQNASEDTDEETSDSPPKPKEPAAAPKPFTDEELAAKLRSTAEVREEWNEANGDQKIESVEVGKDLVRTVTTRSFGSLAELLENSYAVWGEVGLYFENVRFEKDAENHFRVTLTPPSRAGQSLKSYRQRWKLSGATNELALVFPGKVLTSGLPQTRDNTTSIAIEAQRDETIDAALKLYSGPTVITAELGGLKLDEPLESKNLRRRGGRHNVPGDLPIMDAGPGFVAESESVTTTTLYYFPEGEKRFKSSQMAMYGGQKPGIVVSAKLFAPKGRILQTVSDTRVLKATDDKGRDVTPASEGDENYSTSYSYSGSSQEATSAQIQLNVKLPETDAQSIAEISAEAVALTAGSWKEMAITNLQANSSNELDLAEVMPGAKMVIAKSSLTNRQFKVQLRLTGPASVRQLDVKARMSGSDRSNSYVSENGATTKDGQTTRRLTVQGYGFNSEDEAPSTPISLIVRSPQDQRRERVKFKLTALDLF